jgi:type VI secretion system protein ImpD
MAPDTVSPAPLNVRIAALAQEAGDWAAQMEKGGAIFPEPPPLVRFLRADGTAAALELWFGAGRPRGPLQLRAALDRDIAAIDALLTAQVNAVLHAERFKALEAAWRGVHYLMRTADGAPGVKLRILAVSWAEIVRDLDRAPDFDQSELFEKIYSQEFGIAGGEPFGLLIGDYLLSHRRTARHPTDDVAALKSLSAIAAAAFAPFVAGCDPAILGLEGFGELNADVDLDAIFQQGEYARWRGLREVEDMRFVGLCLPRILIRRPWIDEPSRMIPFRFHEAREDAADHGYLWANSAFAFAAVAIGAFARSGWFAEIRGAQRGEPGAGLVDDLPVDTFTTDRAQLAFKIAVEVAVPDRQERVLSEHGFIPVSVAEYVPAAVFYSNQSVYQPPRYASAVANVNARLSAMLQYMLCVGRFAHAIKVIGRDRVGSFATADEIQRMLQAWLTQYVTANQNASIELRTKYPLREGRVTATEVPGRPGFYKLDIHLRPHLQLDDISTGIRLTSELNVRRAA